ncbi:MAG TPA: hypothetical protein VND64_34405 [Pirellulales bacterium]|nr:hypothetical protein [Pirellulales bacterium]
MDTATLVNEQIDDGKRFIDDLKQSRFDVVVAFWVLTSEEGLWFLYIASAVVDTDGLAVAYQRAYGALTQSQVRWVSRSDIKLIGSHNPIAKDAVAYRNNRMITRYHGRKLGSLTVEEAIIYPQ